MSYHNCDVEELKRDIEIAVLKHWKAVSSVEEQDRKYLIDELKDTVDDNVW